MKVVKLDLDFLIGPIVKDVFSESKNVLVTGVDVIDNDEVIADLDKRIMELYSSFYSFDEKDSINLKHLQKMLISFQFQLRRLWI